MIGDIDVALVVDAAGFLELLDVDVFCVELPV